LTTSSPASLLTGPEIAERSRTHLGLLPLGSIEQHGPHMTIDTDIVIARKFAEALAANVPALVLPDFSYGYRSQPASGGGELFPGTASLSGASLTSIISDLVVAWARNGLGRIAIVNGHFENTMFAVEGAQLAVERGADAHVLVINWWEQIDQATLDDIFDGDFPGWEAEHAGVVETSLMMHLDESRVDATKISPHVAGVVPPAYAVIPERPGLVDPSGVLRTAHGSSAELGEALFGAAVQRMADVLEREFEVGVA